MTLRLPRVALGVLVAALAAAVAVLVAAPTPPPPPPATPVVVEPVRVDGNRTVNVGPAMPPGVYGNDGGDRINGICYWARLSGTDGHRDSIIEDGVDDGRTRVTVAPADRAFASRGCDQWVRQP